MDDSSKKFQTGSSDGRAQEQKEWERIRKLERENEQLVALADLIKTKADEYKAENAALRARVEELEAEIAAIKSAISTHY